MKLLTKFKNWLFKTFKSVKKELKTIIPIAIDVVNAMKKFVDSPGCDFLTSVIPGTIDNQLQTFLSNILPEIWKGLHKWQSIIGVEDVNQQMKLILEELKTLPQSERNNIKTQAAAEIVVKVSNFLNKETVATDEAFLMVKSAYMYPEILNENETV